MPARSRAQFRFMKAAAAGDIKSPSLSKKEAAEYVEGQSPKGLPKKVKSIEDLKRIRREREK